MKSKTTASAAETRRTFLQKTATAAAALGVTSLFRTPVYGQNQAPSANVAGANQRLTVGLLGTGAQGRAHLKICLAEKAANNVVVAAVCDVYQKRLDEARAAAGLEAAHAYRQHEQVLERKDIDAVIIAATDPWHAPLSLAALRAGKHVYCEKPMTRYVAEGWAVYDAVQKSGKVYQCGSQYTADPMIHQAAQWIRDGKIGPLAWAQGAYCRNNPKNSEWTYPNDADASPANLDWDRWQGQTRKVPWSPERYFSWHKFYAYNSGILGNLLSHRFMPLMLATGNPEFPLRVVCTGTRKISTDREIPDTTHVLAEFPSGLTFVIAGTTVNQVGLPDILRGRKGTIYFSQSQNKAELRPEQLFAEEIDPADFSDPRPVGRIEHLHTNFYDCIRQGGTPFCNVDLSVKCNTVLCLAEMSERLNLAILFDPRTRKITSGDGKEVPPLTYDTVVPARS